jgi:PAS domain-containing protein
VQQPPDILPVLYDLSVTIGAEMRLYPLLRHTLQRLLYHTSYSAGFVCLQVEDCPDPAGSNTVTIDAAVGDFDLISMVGKSIPLPCEMVCGERTSDSGELTQPLPEVHAAYRAFLRLPLDGRGVVVLLAMEKPDTSLTLTQILKPVLSQLSKAIVLCKSNDAQIAAAEAAQQTMQRSLQRLEEQYRSIVELSPIGVGLSSDGVIREVNQVWLEMFGYQDETEVRGRSLLDCIAPSARADIVDRLRRRAR